MSRPVSRIVMATLLVLAGVSAGCRASSPSAPSPAPAPASGSTPPSITAVSPEVGSTGGGTQLTMIGSGFQHGALVRIDGMALDVRVVDDTTIRFSAPPHSAGPIDIVVANPDGTSGRIAVAYTYLPPSSFDFNGDWIGAAGDTLPIELRFTVREDVLVSLSCGASGTITFSPPPAVNNGEFSVVRNGSGVSARIVSPSDAVGTIDLPPCASSNWTAHRSPSL